MRAKGRTGNRVCMTNKRRPADMMQTIDILQLPTLDSSPQWRPEEVRLMHLLRHIALKAATIFAAASVAAGAQAYKVTNILSDGSVPAVATDANFKNPWAISASGNFWISAAGTGFNYVVPASGTIAFKVIVPTAAAPNTAPGLPAGSVTTAGSVGMNLTNGTKASFIFSTLDGTISGWNSRLGTANAISTVMINNSAAGASYPGLALLNIATAGVTSKSYLLAANFGTGNGIEVYDSTFAPTKLAGSFTDPNLPAGYAPFGIHIIGTQIFVTYALRTTTRPFLSVNGAGNGIVDVYDNTGTLVSRVASNGNLNAPWGVAYAPANFGIFSNDLLIGNFGDGIINAYDPKTFAFLGQLMDSNGKALKYASLWELLPGGTTVTGTTAVSSGDTSTVYFTAGLESEQHGLLGGIASGTTTGAKPTFGFSSSAGAATVTAGSNTQITLSSVSVNGFTGNVVFGCNGLPTGSTCSFSQPVAAVGASAPNLTTVTITTTKATAALHPFGKPGTATGIALATLMPFAFLLGMRRNRLATIRLFSFGLILAASAAVMGGCSDSATPATTTTSTATPAGTSNVTITAVSDTITQQAALALTVK